ncbi:Hypothetical_protein [Hexamita inflata]|uniref:Hypothetical_protein n=1 Tax=Hexamita inflata TaxID=28002 RepID=A0AA86RIK2_9EUKA|nr:Hypothetical protein HINF_LOCUS64872 [Hexamita inflata]
MHSHIFGAIQVQQQLYGIFKISMKEYSEIQKMRANGQYTEKLTPITSLPNFTYEKITLEPDEAPDTKIQDDVQFNKIPSQNNQLTQTLLLSRNISSQVSQSVQQQSQNDLNVQNIASLANIVNINHISQNITHQCQNNIQNAIQKNNIIQNNSQTVSTQNNHIKIQNDLHSIPQSSLNQNNYENNLNQNNIQQKIQINEIINDQEINISQKNQNQTNEMAFDTVFRSELQFYFKNDLKNKSKKEIAQIYRRKINAQNYFKFWAEIKKQILDAEELFKGYF